MAQDSPPTEAQLIRSAVELVRGRLPEGWTVSGPERTRGIDDALCAITSIDGRTVWFVIEAKVGTFTGRQAYATAALAAAAETTESVPLLVARYLSPPVRDLLEAAGVSYVDLTGNMRVVATSPGLYIADRGEDKDPWRGSGRPRASLKGDPAARVVRALLDHARAWRVRDLIEASDASTGATYRVMEHLDVEGLADRGEDGLWRVPDWERLLRAWADDYGFLTANTVSRFIAPRGLAAFRRILLDADAAYAVTGAAASEEWASVAPTKSMFVYVEDIARASAAWGLRPVDAGVNVVLLEPRVSDSAVFRGAGLLADGVRRAAPAQVAVDLLNGPGREPQEGEELLRWMRENEREWRLP